MSRQTWIDVHMFPIELIMHRIKHNIDYDSKADQFIVQIHTVESKDSIFLYLPSTVRIQSLLVY